MSRCCVGDGAHGRIFHQFSPAAYEEFATIPAVFADVGVHGKSAVVQQIKTLGRCWIHENEQPPTADIGRDRMDARRAVFAYCGQEGGSAPELFMAELG